MDEDILDFNFIINKYMKGGKAIVGDFETYLNHLCYVKEI